MYHDENIIASRGKYYVQTTRDQRHRIVPEKIIPLP